MPRLLSLVPFIVAATACHAPAPEHETPPPARWYKGNLHTHTLWSDGDHFPEMVVDWYAQRDYDFLALTEHNIVADHEKWVQNDLVIRRGGRTALADYRQRFGREWVEERDIDGKLEVRLKRLDEIRPEFEKPGEFLLITAEEVTSGFDGHPVHINATNVAGAIEAKQGDSVRAVMRNNLRAIAEHADANGRPVLAHLNHPNFGWGVSAEDLAVVTEERYFEVYNGHPSVHHRGDEQHPGVERLWDIANTTRRRDLGAPLLFGLATDDSHDYHGVQGSTPGRGWVMVRARELTAEALVTAIGRGEFYASSGVTLADVHFDGRTLALEIAAAPGASYVTEFVGTRRGSDAVGEVLARCEGIRPTYRLQGDEWYVRATVTSSLPADNPVWDGQKRQAWVQPVVPPDYDRRP